MPHVKRAFKIDLGKVEAAKGVALAAAKREERISEADPLFWLRSMDPETAELVETQEVATPDPSTALGAGGGTETLYVIEGKPVERLLAYAHQGDRDKLPIEPLLRITVGEDGFPRHVLVQRYCPKWDVLELTVTDYELNPDLPDSLFEFEPSEGVKVIEADPTMWQ
jgi:hypothetical protein